MGFIVHINRDIKMDIRQICHTEALSDQTRAATGHVLSSSRDEKLQGVPSHWEAERGLLRACFRTYEVPKALYVTLRSGANCF